MKLIKPQLNRRLAMLVYGEAGNGKTSLARSIPKDEGICILSGESGELSILDILERDNVDCYDIANFEDMREAWKTLKSNDDFKKKYKWIFIDSLTEIAERCLESMRLKYPNDNQTFKLWGGYGDSMKALIKSFRDLTEYSVVFTCLVEAEQDDFKRRFVRPAIQGKQLKDRLTSYFDEVFYLAVRTDEESAKHHRFFYTQPGESPRGIVEAKDRSGKLDPIVEPAHIGNVMKKIFGGK